MIGTFWNRLLASTLSFLLVVCTTPLGVALSKRDTRDKVRRCPRKSCNNWSRPSRFIRTPWWRRFLEPRPFRTRLLPPTAGFSRTRISRAQTLMQAVDKQPWDPSVKAITQFPSVLDNLAKNLSWTSALGEAYHTQAADVMSAVQVLRAKAQAAGNLKSGSQITVVQQSPQMIVIQPANPQVVYVPQYNPTVVYGTPFRRRDTALQTWQRPAFLRLELASLWARRSITTVVADGVIATGTAIGTAGPSYYRGTVYYGNNAWRGGYYGSTATAYGPYGSATVGRGYNPSTGTYARGGTVSTPYGTRSAGQAYNPSTGTYARGTSASGRMEAQRPAKHTTRIGGLSTWRSASTAYGSAAAGQAYNPTTGAYGATRQASNAYGNCGSSVDEERPGRLHPTSNHSARISRNGTNYDGGKGVAATGANGNTGAVGQTANGNKYAAANGNAYQNTGGGWNQTQGTPHQTPTTSSYSGANSAAARGYGGQQKSSGTTAFGGRWRRLANPAGERSWFCKPRWWRRLARPQVSPVAPSAEGDRW